MFRPLVIIFIAVALATGIPLATITPPGHVPDETGHILRAAGLLMGQVVGHQETIPGPYGKPVRISGVLAEPTLLVVASILQTDRAMTATEFQGERLVAWSRGRMFMAIGGIATYFPVFYIPSALALAGCKLLGTTPFAAILVGRCVNLLIFVVAGAFAVRITRAGRAVLFAVLTCPMTLTLAASFNEDGLLIVSCVVACAMLTRASPRDRLLAGAIIGVVGAVKPPYLVLALALLVPLPADATGRARRREIGRRLGWAGLVVLPGLAWTAWMFAAVAAPTPRPEYLPGPLWPGPESRLFDSTDVAAQLRVLRAAPRLLATLAWSYFTQNDLIGREMVGVLGWLNFNLPDTLYRAWYVAAACAVISDVSRGVATSSRWRDRLLVLAALACAAWAIVILQYLTWSNVGASSVDGVQGRYFLPLAAFLPLALPAPRARWGGSVSALCLAVPIIAAVAGLFVLPPLIVASYYVH